MNVGKNSTRSNGDASEQLVQLLVILDSQRNVTGHNSALLVVPGRIASKLQDLSAEVLEHSGEVNRGAGSHSRGILALAEVTSNTTNGELKPGLRGRAG